MIQVSNDLVSSSVLSFFATSPLCPDFGAGILAQRLQTLRCPAQATAVKVEPRHDQRSLLRKKTTQHDTLVVTSATLVVTSAPAHVTR